MNTNLHIGRLLLSAAAIAAAAPATRAADEGASDKPA